MSKPPLGLIAGSGRLPMLFASAARAGGHPVHAAGHLGETDPACGWPEVTLSPEEYAGRAARWRARGAVILGGCCGTTPAHVAELTRLPG